MPVDSETPREVLLCCAENELENLHTGETFIVADLFCGYEWRRISIENRKQLGKAFYAMVQNKTGIQALGKTPQNQQRYVVRSSE